MRDQEYGRIVNFSSVVAQKGIPEQVLMLHLSQHCGGSLKQFLLKMQKRELQLTI